MDSSSNVYVLAQLYQDANHGNINQAFAMVIVKFNSSGSVVTKKLIGTSGVYESFNYSNANNEIREWGGNLACLANGKILVLSLIHI